jgi:hypothetical protein
MAPNYRQVQAGCWFLCWACLLTAAFASANINGIADMMILCICSLDALHSTRKLQRVSIELLNLQWGSTDIVDTQLKSFIALATNQSYYRMNDVKLLHVAWCLAPYKRCSLVS